MVTLLLSWGTLQVTIKFLKKTRRHRAVFLNQKTTKKPNEKPVLSTYRELACFNTDTIQRNFADESRSSMHNYKCYIKSRILNQHVCQASKQKLQSREWRNAYEALRYVFLSMNKSRFISRRTFFIAVYQECPKAWAAFISYLWGNLSCLDTRKEDANVETRIKYSLKIACQLQKNRKGPISLACFKSQSECPKAWAAFISYLWGNLSCLDTRKEDANVETRIKYSLKIACHLQKNRKGPISLTYFKSQSEGWILRHFYVEPRTRGISISKRK